MNYNYIKFNKKGKPKWVMDKEEMIMLNEDFEFFTDMDGMCDKEILRGNVSPRQLMNFWLKDNEHVHHNLDIDVIEEIEATNPMGVWNNYFDYRELLEEWELFKALRTVYKKSLKCKN